MIEKIENAANRLLGICNITPVLSSRTLNNKTNCEVFLKCENFQRAGAFKFRGAYNSISQLSSEEKKRGIVTHSSGNHAQAVALVGKLLNIKTVIVMPDNAPQIKINATKDYGAEIIFSKSTIEARVELCNKLIDDHGYSLIHPYDNINVIYGAATSSLELLDEVGDLDYVIAPIGGGGLISGTSAYGKESKKVKFVIGAEPENANDAYRSFKSKNLVTFHEPNTIADGLRTVLSPLTFNFIKKYVDEIITVSEEEIINAVRFLWERMKIIIEPSGAVPLSALINGIKSGQIKKNSKVGLILSGGNVDLSVYFENLID